VGRGAVKSRIERHCPGSKCACGRGAEIEVDRLPLIGSRIRPGFLGTPARWDYQPGHDIAPAAKLIWPKVAMWERIQGQDPGHHTGGRQLRDSAVGFALLHTPLHTEASFSPPVPANY